MANANELRRQRLDARLAELEQLIGFNAATRDSAGPWQEYAQQNLEKAREALGDEKSPVEKLQVAWAYCHQAYRFLSWSLDDDVERRQNAKPLRREAEAKLKNWRKEAVLDVIGREPAGSDVPSKGDLLLAQSLLDQHFENVYFKLDVLASRVRLLPLVLLLMVAAVLSLSWFLGASAGDAGCPKPASLLFDCKTVLVVLMLGAVGATLSNTLSALSAADRIPQVLRGRVEWTVRPLLGALSAVAVVLVLQSDLLPIKSPEKPMIFAYALVAGFTDRLLNRVMRAVEQSAEK